jgi:hypothetical protein
MATNPVLRHTRQRLDRALNPACKVAVGWTGRGAAAIRLIIIAITVIVTSNSIKVTVIALSRMAFHVVNVLDTSRGLVLLDLAAGEPRVLHIGP